MGLYTKGGNKIGGMYMADGHGGSKKIGGMYYSDGNGTATKIYMDSYPTDYVLWSADNQNGNGFGTNIPNTSIVKSFSDINMLITPSRIKKGIRVYINTKYYYGYFPSHGDNKLFEWSDYYIPGGGYNYYLKPNSYVDIYSKNLGDKNLIFQNVNKPGSENVNVFMSIDKQGIHFSSGHAGTIFDFPNANRESYSLLLIEKITVL